MASRRRDSSIFGSVLAAGFSSARRVDKERVKANETIKDKVRKLNFIMVIPFLLLGNLTLRDFKALIQRHAKVYLPPAAPKATRAVNIL